MGRARTKQKRGEEQLKILLNRPEGKEHGATATKKRTTRATGHKTIHTEHNDDLTK